MFNFVLICRSAAEEEDLNIEEEYKIWKTNSQILYDYGLQETLTWPSLTVQWLPKPVVEASSATHNRYQMLLGTQTDGSDNNYLMLAEIALPTSEHAMVFDDEFDRAQEGGFGRALAKNSLFPVSTAPKKKTFQVMKKIVHEGEVNRARYMHQNTVCWYSLVLLYCF